MLNDELLQLQVSVEEGKVFLYELSRGEKFAVSLAEVTASVER
jgi:hypothetical protein